MLARMSRLIRSHVEVYVFRRRARRVEFLCLQRSPGRTLPGAWQPVTGKVRRGEHAARAAAREVREETGLTPRKWWALESVTIYFDAAADAVRALPLFAAEVDARDAVTLSREHVAYAWLPARAAGNRYLWEAQRRGLEAVRAEVLARPRLARALKIEGGADHAPRQSAAIARRAPSSRTRARRPRAG
jgi:8-oxo-dGTP pyrophosphatase MutT (NUDIX family)